MPNILDTVQISGSSYDLKDKNAPSVSAVTQQEYDNLPSSAKTSNTFFVITDAQAGDLTQYWTSAQTNSAITQAVSGKTDNSDFTAHTGNSDIHVTSAEKAAWNAKSDFSGSYNDLTNKLSAGTNVTIIDNVINASGGGSITIDPSLDSGSTNAVANSAITNAINNRQAWRNGGYWGNFAIVDSETYNNRTYDRPMVTRYMNYKGQTNLWETLDNLGYFVRINGKKIIAKEKTDQDLLDYDLVATSAITTAITSSSTDAQVPSAKAVNDKLGGLSIVKLTQSEYDGLATKDNSTLYVVTDS